MLDFVSDALRSALGVERAVESEVQRHSPAGEPHRIEEKLHEAVNAVHRTAAALEQQVALLDSLATSLPPLTESVNRLTDEIGRVLELGAPLQAVERDVSRLGALFHRRPHDSDTPETSSPPS